MGECRINMRKIDLKGTWGFCLDMEKAGLAKKYYNTNFNDIISLPGTVASAKKGTPTNEVHVDHLTDPYQFEGFTWYSRDIEVSLQEGKEIFLVLERTRISHVWIDDQYIGSNNSLCTAHRYKITPFISGKNKLTIMIDNTSYPVAGGHMTSPDTQTNWNGIIGEIYLEECNAIHLNGIKIYPDAVKKRVEVRAELCGAKECYAKVSVIGNDSSYPAVDYELHSGENTFTYMLDETAKTWSEHTPHLYQMKIIVKSLAELPLDEYLIPFGLRDFKAVGKYFEINGLRTFLRGKHDGLIFPMSGYSPTDLQSWLKVLSVAKEYGINHYRFHTCCPPEAAFTAADMMGIYMEPELPFWGTVTEEGQENHNEKAQNYLIQEGFRILDAFGNHPSFVMMSLGNELWGSKNKLNQILGSYKEYDNRHLYTQGSNNFFTVPCILDDDDFFCGVRFATDRKIRGSFAMCDAPQGHIQTIPPNTNYNYDLAIRPDYLSEGLADGGEVEIQFGTGVKKVKMDSAHEIIPSVPVVSHEIGQYAMYPDFTEIEKYTGVLKARNFEEFQKRLENAGMLPMANLFFKASGRLAVECYRAELETALRSNELAGFQILDLQDFTGQGTALVGILNAFMENKGLITSDKWRQFCSDTVLLAEFPEMIFTSGQSISIGLKLATYQSEMIVNPKVEVRVLDGDEVIYLDEKIINGAFCRGTFSLCDSNLILPITKKPQKLKVNVSISLYNIENNYSIWVYPEIKSMKSDHSILITDHLSEAYERLMQGGKVLLYPETLCDTNSIQGTYCTDFWCYPMFSSISKSMNKPLPIGTLGLYINEGHHVFDYFPTEYYTSPQWYDIVTNSWAFILDGYSIEPIVWTIDNFERNHKLGNMFELKIGDGSLFVCTADLRKLQESYPAKWLEYSILRYMSSNQFMPQTELGFNELSEILDSRNIK